MSQELTGVLTTTGGLGGLTYEDALFDVIPNDKDHKDAANEDEGTGPVEGLPPKRGGASIPGGTTHARAAWNIWETGYRVAFGAVGEPGAEYAWIQILAARLTWRYADGSEEGHIQTKYDTVKHVKWYDAQGRDPATGRSLMTDVPGFRGGQSAETAIDQALSMQGASPSKNLPIVWMMLRYEIRAYLIELQPNHRILGYWVYKLVLEIDTETDEITPHSAPSMTWVPR